MCNCENNNVTRDEFERLVNEVAELAEQLSRLLKDRCIDFQQDGSEQ